MITEDQLEQLCLDWFADQGYLYKNGYDIAPDGDTPERDPHSNKHTLNTRVDSLTRACGAPDVELMYVLL